MKDTGGELRVKTSRLSVGVPIKDTDDIYMRVPLRNLGYRVKRGRGQRRNRRNREPLGDRRVHARLLWVSIRSNVQHTTLAAARTLGR